MGLVMKNKFPLISLILLALPTALFADIVYQGKRVESWPEEAKPTFNANALLKTTAVTTKSHYAAPKGKIYSLTLLVDFSDKPAPVTLNEVEDWLNKEGFNRDGCNGIPNPGTKTSTDTRVPIHCTRKSLIILTRKLISLATTTTKTDLPRPSTSCMQAPDKHGDKACGPTRDGLATLSRTESDSRTTK